MDLNLLNTYVAVVEAGSMTQAARRLKQPVSRVSRALSRLERDLNQHLILRTTRSFQVTEAGRRLFRDIQPMMRQIGEVQRSMMSENESEELTGLVRITGPEDLGVSFVAPLIAELSALHPGLEFDLNFTDDYVDLVRTETDIGIRAGKLRDSTLKAKRLGFSKFQFLASPRYLEKFGTPKRPKDLEQHRCIYAQLGPMARRSEWIVTNGTRTERIDVRATWTVNQKGAAISLARAGLGITFVPVPNLPEYFDRGELVQVLPNWGLEPSPIHLVYPPQKVLSKRVREVSTFLESRLKPLF
jgi:LysR family transcriptional regulator, regulator for bpeEF and oprC